MTDQYLHDDVSHEVAGEVVDTFGQGLVSVPAFPVVERRSGIPDDGFDVIEPPVLLPHRKGHAFRGALRRGLKASSSVSGHERKGSSHRSLFAEVVPMVGMEHCGWGRGTVASCIVRHAPDHACIKDVPRSITDRSMRWTHRNSRTPVRNMYPSSCSIVRHDPSLASQTINHGKEESSKEESGSQESRRQESFGEEVRAEEEGCQEEVSRSPAYS